MSKAWQIALIVSLVVGLNAQSRAAPASFEDVLMQPSTPADMVLAYGDHPDQFGELRLPHGPGPHPVLVLIHGGCWMEAYDVAHIRPLADAITGLGYATWTLAYRRPGGDADPWPDTFMDVSQGLDELRDLAEELALDLDTVTVLGHSAGGQLALWLAARANFPEDHLLYWSDPLPVHRVVALAPITDMVDFAAVDQGCNAGARQVMGGAPDEQPERYRAVSPVDNLPLASRVDLVHARADRIVPLEHSERFAADLTAGGGQVSLHPLSEPAGHFDVLLTYGASWSALEALLAVQP
ncbi:MAG: alpha/beta hydrolase [Wenzhouxiangellaceae bacterium]|nr:MAG: alpha/beta hydrolase [Wenzhouxiangellaceae bacterium]